MIEHVADHDHSALRPLSHPAEIGVIELRLAPLSFGQRAEQGDRGVEADAMALRRFGDHAKSFGREGVHCLPNPVCLANERIARGRRVSAELLDPVFPERELGRGLDFRLRGQGGEAEAFAVTTGRVAGGRLAPHLLAGRRRPLFPVFCERTGEAPRCAPRLLIKCSSRQSITRQCSASGCARSRKKRGKEIGRTGNELSGEARRARVGRI